MIIGICGKSGSGKSSLANELRNTYGNKVIHCDIDKIGHKSLLGEEAKKKLVKCFGKQILKDNCVDRKELGKIVFNSKKEMDKLTDITWGFMQEEIDKIIESNTDKIILLDWQLLPKSKYFDKCDIKVLLDIPYEVRLKRALLRDNISEKDFKLREKASYKYDKTRFNLVLENNSKEEYERIVDLI